MWEEDGTDKFHDMKFPRTAALYARLICEFNLQNDDSVLGEAERLIQVHLNVGSHPNVMQSIVEVYEYLMLIILSDFTSDLKL